MNAKAVWHVSAIGAMNPEQKCRNAVRQLVDELTVFGRTLGRKIARSYDLPAGVAWIMATRKVILAVKDPGDKSPGYSVGGVHYRKVKSYCPVKQGADLYADTMAYADQEAQS